MIYLILGRDNFRAHQKLNELINDRATNANVFIFDFLNEPLTVYQSALTAFQSSSLFSDPKWLIFQNFLSTKEIKTSDFLKKVESHHFKQNKDQTIIFYETEAKLAKGAENWFQKNADKTFTFDLLKGAALDNHLKNLEKQFDILLDEKAKTLLLQFTGSDSGLIYQLIFKLSLTGLKKINYSLLQKYLPELPFGNIYEWIDAFLARQKEKSFTLLINNLKRGEEPGHFFNLIVYQLRNLLKIKSLNQSSSQKIILNDFKDWNYYKNQALAKKFNYEDLKKIYRQLNQYDYQIKIGRLDYLNALFLLISDI